MLGFVYILTNEAMPGLIKIGMTDQDDVESRIRGLDTTGVALPFQCYYAAKVEDNRKVERALHTAFGDFRIRPNREFFRLDPYKVKAILEVLELEDVTPRIEIVESPEDIQALRNANIKAGRFKFSTASIPVGSTLNFVKDLSITATVIEDTWVEYQGQRHSLTTAALEALIQCGYNWSSVQGPEYWLFRERPSGATARGNSR
jgi:hypothetical protein